MQKDKFHQYIKQSYADLKLLDEHITDSDRAKLSLTEKLAFLRNVEALHRSEEARKRTIYALIAMVIGISGLLILVGRSLAGF